MVDPRDGRPHCARIVVGYNPQIWWLNTMIIPIVQQIPDGKIPMLYHPPQKNPTMVYHNPQSIS